MSYVAAAGQADPGDTDSGSGAPTGVGGSLVASPFGEVVASAGSAAATGGHRHRHSTRWPRLGRRSRCCATAQALFRPIGQNRWGDDSAGTTERPAELGTSGRSRPTRPTPRPLAALRRAAASRCPRASSVPAAALVATDRELRRRRRGHAATQPAPTRSGCRPDHSGGHAARPAGRGQEEEEAQTSRPAVDPAGPRHRGRASSSPALIGVELYVRNKANNKIAAATACEVKDQATASFGVTPLVTVAGRHRPLHQHLDRDRGQPDQRRQGHEAAAQHQRRQAR